MRRLLLDTTPLRVSAAFRRLWLGMSLTGIGTSLTTVAIGLHVFELTRSSLAVGIVGVAALVPLVTLGLYGGALVDALDRRRVILVSEAGTLLVAMALAVLAWTSLADPVVLYVLVAAQNACFAVNAPARRAAVPRLIPLELLPAANALWSTSHGLAATIGPALAGVLIVAAGYGWAYGLHGALALAALILLALLPPLPPLRDARRVGIMAVVEGLRYIAARSVIRMTFLVDLVAMVLAMPRVLFPAVGGLWIGGGATTAGLLVSAMAVGTLLGGVFSGSFGRVRRQGVAIVVAVVVWGGAVAAFGLVVLLSPLAPLDGSARWTLWPALACMLIAGAADTVSAVFRATILQAAAPDELRGRLQGVFVVVVAGGPQLGALVLGALAASVSEPAAAIVGGVACVGVVLGLSLLHRGLLRYRAPGATE